MLVLVGIVVSVVVFILAPIAAGMYIHSITKDLPESESGEPRE